MTWHDVEWFMQYFANPAAAVLLLGVTGWYAVTTRRIMRSSEKMATETKSLADETKRMAEETARMAEASQKTYLASLAPNLRFETHGIGQRDGNSTARIDVFNRGQQHVFLRQVRAQTTDRGEVRYEIPKGTIVFPGARRTVEAVFQTTTLIPESLLFDVGDIADQTHLISPHWLPKDF